MPKRSFGGPLLSADPLLQPGPIYGFAANECVCQSVFTAPPPRSMPRWLDGRDRTAFPRRQGVAADRPPRYYHPRGWVPLTAWPQMAIGLFSEIHFRLFRILMGNRMGKRATQSDAKLIFQRTSFYICRRVGPYGSLPNKSLVSWSGEWYLFRVRLSAKSGTVFQDHPYTAYPFRDSSRPTCCP
jgi:hypothetical protein